MTKFEKVQAALNQSVYFKGVDSHGYMWECADDAFLHHARFEGVVVHEIDAQDGHLVNIWAPGDTNPEPDIITKESCEKDGLSVRLSAEPCTPKGSEFLKRYIDRFEDDSE